MSWKYRCHGVEHIYDSSESGGMTAAFQMALNARGRVLQLPASGGEQRYDEEALAFLAGARDVTETMLVGALLHSKGPVVAVVSPPRESGGCDWTRAITVIGITTDGFVGYLDPADITGAVHFMDRRELEDRSRRVWVLS